MHKIRVLNIITMIGDGGLEMLVCNIYKGLDENIFDKHLCILTTDTQKGFIYEEFLKANTKFEQFDFNNTSFSLKSFFKNIKQFFLLVRYIRRNKFDIVHTHDFFPALMGRGAVIFNKLFFSRYPKKIYTTYHNIYYWLKKPHRVINKFLSFFTDNIICVSKSAMLDSVEKEKIKVSKYKVIYNGLNPDEFYYDEKLRNSFRNKYNINNNEIIIGCVGVISVRKGQIYLLKAFNKLNKRYNNLKLVIVGGTRSQEMNIYDEMIDYIIENNLKDSIKFIEPIKDVNGIYNMIDIFVMPSITEGFGLSAFEYMLTDRICLFSDINVFTELTKNGKFGLHFKNKNVEDLEEKLEYLINNYENSNKNNNLYREFVIQNYNINDMRKRYIELYNFKT